jgi:DNA-binding NtrC family response regulator
MSKARKPRLLIVDDQPQIRGLLEEYFAAAEFAVAAVADVPAAVATLPNGFDVVISDIRMPGQSGIDFLQQAKAQQPTLGVFLITGYPEMGTIVDAKCYGAQAYFQKPLNLEVLEERIREYLATVDTGALQAERPCNNPVAAAS